MSDKLIKIQIGNIHAKPTDLADTQQIIDLIYPIGSIYTSLDANFDPNVQFPNTVWKKIKSGIFLESTEDTAQVGNEVQAGLPNITGGCNAAGYVLQPMDGYGAFQSTYLSGASYAGNSSWGANVSWNMDASRCNAIYGKSTTVQPHSIKCFVWQRILSDAAEVVKQTANTTLNDADVAEVVKQAANTTLNDADVAEDELNTDGLDSSGKTNRGIRRSRITRAEAE